MAQDGPGWPRPLWWLEAVSEFFSEQNPSHQVAYYGLGHSFLLTARSFKIIQHLQVFFWPVPPVPAGQQSEPPCVVPEVKTTSPQGTWRV